MGRKRKASGQMKDVRVTVTGEYVRRSEAVAEKLAKLGMQVEEVLECGMVFGYADMAFVDKFAAVPGVFDVRIQEIKDDSTYSE